MRSPTTPRLARSCPASLLALLTFTALPACDGDDATADPLLGTWMITTHTYAQGECAAPGAPVSPGFDVAIVRPLPSAGAGALELLVCRDATGAQCDDFSDEYVRPHSGGGYGAEDYVAQWIGSECVGTRRSLLITLATSGDAFHFQADTIQGAVPGADSEAACTLDAVEAAAATAGWPCVGREILDATR